MKLLDDGKRAVTYSVVSITFKYFWIRGFGGYRPR